MSDNSKYEVRELSKAPDEFSGFCPIAPVPKGRPRFSRKGKFVQTYTPKETEEYENAIRKFMRKEYGFLREPMDGTIYAKYEFVLPRPKSKSKKAIWSDTKPDVDNLVKSFQDGLDFKSKDHGVELGVIANDSRVSCVNATKRFAKENEIPGTYFTFRNISKDIVIASEHIAEDPLRLIDPSFLRITPNEISSFSKSCANVELAYICLCKEDKNMVGKIIDDAKKTFPNLRKIIAVKF